LAKCSSKHHTSGPFSSLEGLIACIPEMHPSLHHPRPISFPLQSYYHYQALVIKEVEVGTSAEKACRSVTQYFARASAEKGERDTGSEILGNLVMDGCLEGT